MTARLAPAVSALARQTMRTAFEDLERTVTPADSRNFQGTTLQQVRAAALDIENQLAARQSLRNMRRLTPLLNGLEHYAKVVDVLCNGTPYLAWVWAPLTLILRVASEYIEAFEQLMKGYKRIADALGRFEILGDAFIENADFQHTIAVFYADILQFHKHAYKFVRRNGWRLLFLTSWGRFQRRFDTILDDLNRHGSLIDLEANSRNIAEARGMRKDLRTWREEIVERVQRDEEEQATKQYHSIMSWLKIDESEQLKIFESIAEEGIKHPGTCGWILKNQKIRSWLQRRSDTPFIWLQGKPGSGKSVLTTQIINFIQASGMSVIYHICTYSHATSTKYEHIVRSLLLQLLRRNGELVAYVYQEFVIEKKLPTILALEQLLQKLLQALSDEPRNTECLWIVLDGLDECENGKQARVMSLMDQITSGTNGGTVCKVLVSSRPSPLLVRRLRRKQVVSLGDQGGEVEHAIKKYTSQRLRSLHDRLRQLELESADIEEIEDAVAKKADGMFLYARLVLDYLGTNVFFSGEELKESIHLLPETLSEFYRRIWTQIFNNQDARSVCRIKSILGWIAFAKRPLKKLELLSALSFSVGNPSITRLVPQYILDICSPLVEERRDSTMFFIHVSVKEFLQNNSSGWIIDEQNAYNEHGVAAITCLLSGLEVFDDACDEHTRSLRLVKGIHGFHVYATEYWTDYILNEAVETNSIDTSSPLFTIVSRLVHILDERFPSQQPTNIIVIVDQRLEALKPHAALYRQVEYALLARSRKRIESELLENCDADGVNRSSRRSFALDGVSAMLTSYQKSVRNLLNQDSCTGASAEELELFKSHFRTSAFTCRLRQCPRATVGFENDLLRREHEITHAGGFRCTIPGCQYPPSRSAQTLKSHVDRYHNTAPARRSIRRVEGIRSFNQNWGLVNLETHTSITRQSSIGADNRNPAVFNQGQNPAVPLATSKRRNLILRVADARLMLVRDPAIVTRTDAMQFPLNVLNNQQKADIPASVKSWRQLRDWVTMHQTLVPDVSIENLTLLQVLCYRDFVRNQNRTAMHTSPVQAISPGHVQTPQQPYMRDVSLTDNTLQQQQQGTNDNQIQAQGRDYVLNRTRMDQLQTDQEWDLNAMANQQIDQNQQTTALLPQQRTKLNAAEIRVLITDPVKVKAFNQIIEEVTTSLPPRQPVQLPLQSRVSLQKSLREHLDKLKKFEYALRVYHVCSEDVRSRNVVRDMAKACALIFLQINNQNGTLHDQTTLTADEFREYLRLMINFYAKVIKEIVAGQELHASTQQSQPSEHTSQKQHPQKPSSPLSMAQDQLQLIQRRKTQAASHRAKQDLWMQQQQDQAQAIAMQQAHPLQRNHSQNADQGPPSTQPQQVPLYPPSATPPALSSTPQQPPPQQQGAIINPMQPQGQNRMLNQMGKSQYPLNQEFDFNAIANQQIEAMRVQDKVATAGLLQQQPNSSNNASCNPDSNRFIASVIPDQPNDPTNRLNQMVTTQARSHTPPNFVSTTNKQQMPSLRAMPNNEQSAFLSPSHARLASLDPSVPYGQGQVSELVNPAHLRGYMIAPIDTYSDVSSAHVYPYLTHPDNFDFEGPDPTSLLDEQADPYLFHDLPSYGLNSPHSTTAVPYAKSQSLTRWLYNLDGSVDAPWPLPHKFQYPPPPLWLQQALNDLQEQNPYEYFESTMRYIVMDVKALNSNTKIVEPKLVTLDDLSTSTPFLPNYRARFVATIRCLDCIGRLYDAGPEHTVRNFEKHLKNCLHRDNVAKRMGKLSPI